MAKNGKKRTRGRQKSKAALATAEMKSKRRDAHANPDVPESVEYRGTGGVMSNLRGGFQSAVGNGEMGPQKSNWLGNVLWLLLALGTMALVFGDIRL